MNEYLKIILPGSIALIGTIITIFIGYRQWKRQQESSRYASFVTEKQSAYKGLWEKLEEVHIKVRSEDVQISEFNNLLRDINSYILKHSLYLDREDQILSNQYLKDLYRFKEIVAGSDDAHAKEEFAVTGPGMPVETVREFKLLYDEVDRIRNRIIERFRLIIGGSIYQ
jgi:hypothetical protein